MKPFLLELYQVRTNSIFDPVAQNKPRNESASDRAGVKMYELHKLMDLQALRHILVHIIATKGLGIRGQWLPFEVCEMGIAHLLISQITKRFYSQ